MPYWAARLWFGVREDREVVVETLRARAVVARPERGLGDRDAAGEGHALVVVGGAAHHVDVRDRCTSVSVLPRLARMRDWKPSQAPVAPFPGADGDGLGPWCRSAGRGPAPARPGSPSRSRAIAARRPVEAEVAIGGRRHRVRRDRRDRGTPRGRGPSRGVRGSSDRRRRADSTGVAGGWLAWPESSGERLNRRSSDAVASHHARSKTRRNPPCIEDRRFRILGRAAWLGAAGPRRRSR